MKHNADVNLRERARRKWFILLGCALLAGGLWFRADMKKKQAAARLAPNAEQTVAKASAADVPDGSAPLFGDETVANPFVAPGVAFAESDPDATADWAQVDFSKPVRFGLASSSATHGGGFWFGSLDQRSGVAISVSDRAVPGVTIGPEVDELARPVAPKGPALPSASRSLPQTLPRQ